MSKENTKQVIVIRKDLNMRKGKMCAQASHASMAFLTKYGSVEHDVEFGHNDFHKFTFMNGSEWIGRFQKEISHWLDNSFRKICVYVNSEQELRGLHDKAVAAGLMSNLIEDNGATEFHGFKTLTCCAVGPHWDSRFEGITDHLPLL